MKESNQSNKKPSKAIEEINDPRGALLHWQGRQKDD